MGKRSPESEALKKKLTQEYSQQFRRLLQEKGWSVTELANRTGISRVVLSRLLNAQRMPTLDQLQRIATALGATHTWEVFPAAGVIERAEQALESVNSAMGEIDKHRGETEAVITEAKGVIDSLKTTSPEAAAFIERNKDQLTLREVALLQTFGHRVHGWVLQDDAFYWQIVKLVRSRFSPPASESK